jgi:hypothetical protein
MGSLTIHYLNSRLGVVEKYVEKKTLYFMYVIETWMRTTVY